MSQEVKDVRVCFHPLLEASDVLVITQRVLQDFPSRIPPEFRPWFPSASDTHPPIRPHRPAPLIPHEEPLRQGETQSRSRAEEQKFQRTWCVIQDRNAPLQTTQSFSRLFRMTIEKHKLHLRQRVRWALSERNCAGLEDLWVGINRAVRHSRMPTCNANFQRALAQIWLYCDVLYCEYIGNFLKQEFQLSGQITLSVHKLGDIIKL
ncbi:shieldin complex subunit 3 [Danio aesculapii]|uniref:shieldin complex subunit 3 n=1 Tax=Danio aesculapii TaxID=1142201 RepID=UPI0024BFFC3A|nr:shieldin complex subunit 3 [Danio aesculapii]